MNKSAVLLNPEFEQKKSSDFENNTRGFTKFAFIAASHSISFFSFPPYCKKTYIVSEISVTLK